MKHERNYVVYDNRTGRAVSYHTTDELATRKMQRLGYRTHGVRRVA